jgi:hypothetical protein
LDAFTGHEIFMKEVLTGVIEHEDASSVGFNNPSGITGI